MSEKEQLKTYLASLGAVQMFPGVTIVDRGRDGVLSCQIDSGANDASKFFVAFGHISNLLVQHEKAEAKADALAHAHELFPDEDGWTGHSVLLTEVPRSTFVRMGLFMTVREFYHRILHLAGFRSST